MIRSAFTQISRVRLLRLPCKIRQASSTLPLFVNLWSISEAATGLFILAARACVVRVSSMPATPRHSRAARCCSVLYLRENNMNASHRIALITGGSRGIGAATALALAERGHDIVITYRNKAARAEDVITAARQRGVRAIALCSDITQQDDRDQLFSAIQTWGGRLDVLVLNASGGLERDLLAVQPDYPMLINRDAQVALLDAALPLMSEGGVVAFITSHWAHLYGQIEQI